MITIRTAVFETNSSSEHCIVYHKEARDPSEFPPLNADGILEIEVKHLWQCGEAGTETGDVRDIIEYLCVLAINCFPWRDEEKAIGNSLSKTDDECPSISFDCLGIEQIDPKTVLGISDKEFNLLYQGSDTDVFDKDGNITCCTMYIDVPNMKVARMSTAALDKRFDFTGKENIADLLKLTTQGW